MNFFANRMSKQSREVSSGGERISHFWALRASHLPERRRGGTRATAGMVATALDDPRGLNRKKKVKGKVNLVSGKVSKKGSKGGAAVVSVDGEPAEGTAAAAGGDKVLDMVSREKQLKRELNKRAKKFMKGDTVNTKNINDKKMKAHVRCANVL